VRGQATVEYLAAVALLVLVLAGAGVAVAAPDLPGAVVAKLREALCIVGGDVCTSADAARRGLEPCPVDTEDHERDRGVSFLFFRAGGSETWSVQELSDGRILLSAGYGQSFDLTTGIGFSLDVVGAGGSARGGLAFRKGQTWVLPNRAALDRLLARVHGYDLSNGLNTFMARFPPAEETYLEGGGEGAAKLSLTLLKSIGGNATARAMLGRREGPGGTTYYADLGGDAGESLTSALPALALHGHVAAEYAAGSPPVLTLRAAGRGRGSEESDAVLRLPLSDPGDRAAALRDVFLNVVDPTVAFADLLGRIRAHGTIERLRYRVHAAGHAGNLSVALLAKLGYDHSSSVLRRKLIDAEVLGGPFPAQRQDCLAAA
jgi:hypothetical protein